MTIERSPSRLIAIRHRVKRTAAGEARPTQMIVKERGRTRSLILKEESNELDWVRGRLPIKWRLATQEDNLDQVFPWHQKWRKPKAKDDTSTAVWSEDETKVLEIPSDYDGLQTGDVVIMTLGGSGSNMAKGIIARGLQIGAQLQRIPPYQLKEARGDSDDKSDDPARLIELFQTRPELFYLGRPDDLNLIEVAEYFVLWAEAQEARKATQLRLYARSRGSVFRDVNWEAGPVGQLEDEFAKLKASDPTLRALMEEEAKLLKLIGKALKRTEIYTMVLSQVKGLGPSLGGRLVAAIGDHRRFMDTEALNQIPESYQRSERLEADGDLEQDKVHVIDAWQALEDWERTRYRLIEMTMAWQRSQGLSRKAKLLELALEEHRKRARIRGKMASRMKSFCGVGVLRGGKHGDRSPDKQFVRARAGETTPFHRTSKQALYLLGEQFNYRPKTDWGQKLQLYKGRLRAKHPVPVKVANDLKGLYRRIEQALIAADVFIADEDFVCRTKDDLFGVLERGWGKIERERYDQLAREVAELPDKGSYGPVKQLFGNGHIHRMAVWRTVTRFVEWMARELHMLEERKLMSGSHPEQAAAK